MYASYNQNSGYDPSDQGFAAIPEHDRITLNPKLFWTINDDTRLTAGGQFSTEDRLGGDIRYIDGDERENSYFEKHETRRISTQLTFDHRFSPRTALSLKNSFTFFERSITVPDLLFSGHQTASFSELALNHESGAGSWVGGINLWTDRFDEDEEAQASPRDFSTTIWGGFIQHTAQFTDKLSVESGLRLDYAQPETDNALNGWFPLPRVSALYRFNTTWSMRLGGGMGYKLPDMFTDEAENRAFRNVSVPQFEELKAEQSLGFNYDINYRSILADRIVFRVNQLFYYTRLNDPLELKQADSGRLSFANLNGSVRSRGAETNLAFIYKPVKLF